MAWRDDKARATLIREAAGSMQAGKTPQAFAELLFDHINIEGRSWLEWGYRLVPECRGLGYATESSQALLTKAHRTYLGELLSVIAPDNIASQNVCRKLGFSFWKQGPVDGYIRNLYTLPVGEPVR